MTPVTGSSTVKAIGYDAASQTMHVEFHSGKTYPFPGVSSAQHKAFADSPSKGKHFHRHIRGKFPAKV